MVRLCPISLRKTLAVYVALLRAVNVGGTGKLPMSELRSMCESAGFTRVRTYIASGNVVFDASEDEPSIRAKLEEALRAYAGRPVGVLVRTAGEMAKVLASNPFPDGASNSTVAIFLNEPPPADTLEGVRGRNGERIALGEREIYVDYGGNMARSKLSIPAAGAGTARNMNTVARLAAMAAE